MTRKPPLPLVAAIALAVALLASEALGAHGLALTLVNYTVQNDSGNVDLGYTITINSTLRNDDTTAFAGTIQFGLRNSQQELTQADHVFNQPPYTGQQINLNPGEAVPAIFSVHVNDPYFQPGPDVVVVWPISSHPIVDSIVIAIHVHGPNAITPEEEAPFTYFITQNKILLRSIPAETEVKQVRIYNLYGQVMVAYDSGITDEILLGALPRGIYLCEIRTSDKKRKVIKFWH